MKKILDSLKSFFTKIIGKIDIDKVKGFFIKYKRYFFAVLLFVVLLLVLYNCTGPEAKQNANKNKKENEEEFSLDTEFEQDAYEDVNALIEAYFEANAEGDLDKLEKIAYPISNNEKSYIGVFSQYIEEYQNVSCYTKHGITEGAYFVSAYFDMKFYGVDTLAPGVNFFYVEPDEDGDLYINNLYSAYNLSRSENAMDPELYSIIVEYEQQKDVKELFSEVTKKYDAAVASDENLAVMITTTIPNAMREWMDSVNALEESLEQSTEQSTEEETQEVSTEDSSEEEEVDEEPVEQQPVTVSVQVTANSVNVRSTASTSGTVLGKATRGSSYTVLSVEGDWTKIDYNGTPAYIKSEFVQ